MQSNEERLSCEENGACCGGCKPSLSGKITFTFHGWIEAEHSAIEVCDVDGNSVDVSGLTAADIAAKLADGDLLISLGDYLYDNLGSEIVLGDFEALEG